MVVEFFYWRDMACFTKLNIGLLGFKILTAVYLNVAEYNRLKKSGFSSFLQTNFRVTRVTETVLRTHLQSARSSHCRTQQLCCSSTISTPLYMLYVDISIMCVASLQCAHGWLRLCCAHTCSPLAPILRAVVDDESWKRRNNYVPTYNYDSLASRATSLYLVENRIRKKPP